MLIAAAKQHQQWALFFGISGRQQIQGQEQLQEPNAFPGHNTLFQRLRLPDDFKAKQIQFEKREEEQYFKQQPRHGR